MTKEFIVEANNLSKTYRRAFRRKSVQALRNLDLQIQRGQIVGLLGPNGAGKTTTINLLLGFIKPTAGNVQVLGEQPRGVKVKAKIGFLPEESYFYRFLTGEELLHYFAKLFGQTRKQRVPKINALLNKVGMEHARKRRLAEYSKGMLRRIGIAQALLNDPEFVIFDEPTSGLDPLGTREVKDLILELKKNGTTVLLCSHLLADVEEVCDRVVMLYQGEKIQEGRVRDLLTQPEIRSISFRGLEEEGLEKIKAVAKETGAEVIKIENPVDSLEAYFLRTLKERGQKSNSISQ